MRTRVCVAALAAVLFVGFVVSVPATEGMKIRPLSDRVLVKIDEVKGEILSHGSRGVPRGLAALVDTARHAGLHSNYWTALEMLHLLEARASAAGMPSVVDGADTLQDMVRFEMWFGPIDEAPTIADYPPIVLHHLAWTLADVATYGAGAIVDRCEAEATAAGPVTALFAPDPAPAEEDGKKEIPPVVKNEAKKTVKKALDALKGDAEKKEQAAEDGPGTGQTTGDTSPGDAKKGKTSVAPTCEVDGAALKNGSLEQGITRLGATVTYTYTGNGWTGSVTGGVSYLNPFGGSPTRSFDFGVRYETDRFFLEAGGSVLQDGTFTRGIIGIGLRF